MKLLVIVDMQNDFITGSLENKEAQAIVPKICDYVKNFEGMIVCTLDTHYGNYLLTNEGKNLPIPHCIKGTDGWTLNQSIMKAVLDKNTPYYLLEKPTFGSIEWGQLLNNLDIDEIVLVGTCTDICVISNAIILKSLFFDKAKVAVESELCAGVTPEKHEAALEVMRSCQIEVR